MRDWADVIAGMLVMLFLGFLMGSCEARAAGETWGVATVRSYHFNKDTKEYNEKNYGFGLEHRFENSRWGASAGFYDNSQSRTSVYVGATYGIGRVGPAKFGVCLCGVTGYDKYTILPVVLPSVAFEGKRAGVTVGVLPKLVGLQLKWRFQ